MSYTILAVTIIVLALIAVFIAAKLLLRGHWFLGWLRGMVGLLFIAIAGALTLLAADFSTYKNLTKEQFVANLSFTRIDTQQYSVDLVDAEGNESTYNVMGDLWQLDARILKWSDLLSSLGVSSGYRLDRLSGRYYALEKEKTSPRTVHQLTESKSAIDIWAALKTYHLGGGVVDASYGSATYMPMKDGALFAVNLTTTGLIARPINDRAKASVVNWQ